MREDEDEERGVLGGVDEREVGGGGGGGARRARSRSGTGHRGCGCRLSPAPRM